MWRCKTITQTRCPDLCPNIFSRTGLSSRRKKVGNEKSKFCYVPAARSAFIQKPSKQYTNNKLLHLQLIISVLLLFSYARASGPLPRNIVCEQHYLLRTGARAGGLLVSNCPPKGSYFIEHCGWSRALLRTPAQQRKR